MHMLPLTGLPGCRLIGDARAVLKPRIYKAAVILMEPFAFWAVTFAVLT
jgi:hypothetical protein